MKFTFGDIVVVDNIQIGVVVKCWVHNNNNNNNEGSNYTYDVYVRGYDTIKTYNEEDIQRYMVRHKYLLEEEKEYQYNDINGI